MPAGFLVSGLALAALHGAAAVLCALTPGAGRLGGFFAGCAVATAAMAWLLFRLLRRVGPSEDPGGRGGAAPGPDGPPPWWPAFEDDFRRYADARPATRREPVSG